MKMMHPPASKSTRECYKVTDFGDSGTAMSPLDICMYEENIRFPEAIALLASRYNVTDELKRSVNKPDIRKRPATADEAEGAGSSSLKRSSPMNNYKFWVPVLNKNMLTHCIGMWPNPFLMSVIAKLQPNTLHLLILFSCASVL